MPLYARTMVRKGGSLAVTIPNKLVVELGFQEGDQLVFIHKGKNNYVFVGNSSMIINLDENVKKMIGTEIANFRSTKLDKKYLKQILKELAKEEAEE